VSLNNSLGPVALLGSGETSLAGGRGFEAIAQRFTRPVRIAILETPAGFELNSASVAGRVGEFLKNRLQESDPQIDVIPARKRDTPFSTDDSQILQPLLHASIIFMGPGSPTYAVRQLKGSLAWDLVRARHRQGAALVFSSAAVIAVGAYALPVYEIYKVGEPVGVLPGLDLFGDFNLQLSLLPHWNNADGGNEVDTSRCFVGIERFNQWCNLLPAGNTIIGVDEHTGFIFNFGTGKCSVSGVGSVTLSRASGSENLPAGAEFPLKELGEFRAPENPESGIPARAWELISNTSQAAVPEETPYEVAVLLESRRLARLQQRWADADALRSKIVALGWTVQDAPEGQKVIKQS
jgi:hypothetical protein